jgi:division protein CdvB (Snf7/Vps24/ESCRT-III family)
MENQKTDLEHRTSYRSLLDTAETIIDMEVRMEQVESNLARVGRSCNPRGLERISNNAVKMDANTRSRGQSFSPH